MYPINNSGWLNICGLCACSGFVPKLNYAYNAGASTMTVTDASDFPAGDDLKIVHVYVRDKFGNQVYGKIEVAEGNTGALNIAGLNPAAGFNILATVVTDNRCVADMSVYDIQNVVPAAGALGNVDNQGSVA